ncbi:MAG: zinc-dependent alcohol dehydrogenase [Brachybacterium sp.]
MTSGELPDVRPTDVLIAPAYSCISAGTELHSVRRARAAAPGGDGRQTGYSQAGTVLAVGAEVERISSGDRVVAVGQGAFHATRTVVAQNLVVPLPEQVELGDAALAAMFCFAIEAVHKSAVRLNQKVIVFGAGMMGQFAARLYQLSGADVAVVDDLDFRRRRLPDGVMAVSPDDAGWERLDSWADPYGVEHACIAFGGDATETIQRLKPLMSAAPDGVPAGRIVFPGGAEIHLTMASAMGNIELLSSAKAGPGYRDPVYESGSDYPQVHVGHPVRRNVETMVELLRTGRLSVAGLVTHRYPFTEAATAYRDLAQHPGEILAALLSYEQE